MGSDGYPPEIFDKVTGEIDPQGRGVLAGALRPEPHPASATGPRSGRSLQGKIHIYVGSADTYFLNDAVYYIEDFLKATKNPPYDGEVQYGDRAEHCWNGDPEPAQRAIRGCTTTPCTCRR